MSKLHKPLDKPLAFFITGTDTEIGKTLVSCTLLYSLARLGRKSIGMKPVAAGAIEVDGVWRNEDVEAIKAASNLIWENDAVDSIYNAVNPYLFKLPAAPHIAAQREDQEIDLEVILMSYQRLTEIAEAIIVEGVGGFRVPLNAEVDSADMAQQLNLPVILVVGMRLGCINQALLSAEAIAARGLPLAGWVANCAQKEMAFLQENCQALSERLNAPMLGCIPYLEKPEPGNAAPYLDLTVLIKEKS